jgi:hypothetical protein
MTLTGRAGEYLVFANDSRQERRLAQRGAGRFKTIAFIAIAVFGLYAAFKLFPPYLAEYQLSDKMQEEARFSVVNRHTEDQTRDVVFKEAQELDIPITKEQIKVFASNSLVKITVDYTVPVDLMIYKMDLHFTPSSENKSLL